MVLFQSLYASEKASAFKRLYFDEQMSRFKSLIQKRHLTFFARNERRLFDRLKDAKDHEFGDVSNKPLPRQFLRANLLPNEYVNRSLCLCFEEEKRLSARAGKSAVSFLVTPTPFRGRYGSIVDAYVEQGAEWSNKSAALEAVLSYVRECYKEWVGDSYAFSFCTERAYRSITLALLHEFFGWHYRVRLQEGRTPLDYDIYALYNGKDIRRWCREVGKEVKRSRLRPSRKWEVTCLRNVLRGERRGIFLVSLSNVKIYDHEWHELAEFDGLYIRCLRRSTYITLIEAKRGIQRSSEKALQQLQKSLLRIGVNHSSPKLKYMRRKGLAYVRAKLPLPKN